MNLPRMKTRFLTHQFEFPPGIKLNLNHRQSGLLKESGFIRLLVLNWSGSYLCQWKNHEESGCDGHRHGRRRSAPKSHNEANNERNPVPKVRGPYPCTSLLINLTSNLTRPTVLRYPTVGLGRKGTSERSNTSRWSEKMSS